jgi:hypothetical protein
VVVKVVLSGDVAAVGRLEQSHPAPISACGAVTYTVAPEMERAWLTAMQQLRRSRLRTGATGWELYRDADRRDRFVEQFRVASWEERLRRHEGRLTAADQAIEQAALSFSDPPASADHLLPP